MSNRRRPRNQRFTRTRPAQPYSRTQLLAARAGAKTDARSGNPARRVPAREAIAFTTTHIKALR